MKSERKIAAVKKRALLKPLPVAILAISAISFSVLPAPAKAEQDDRNSGWESALIQFFGQSQPSRTEQSRTEQSRTEQSRTEQSRTEPSNLEIGITSQQALEILNQIPVKGRAPKTGYSRAAFGPQWSDVDRNGCDTRNDILKRDLTNLVFREKTRECVIESGILLDPFSNTEINFVRGQRTSMLVQIDHVVSLSNAWQTGIFQSSVKERIAFANDPINLLAVKGSLNSQKGDGDAATWLPPHKPFRCKYVTLQINVKAKYGLWVTRAEQEAMVRILSSQECR
ncbi:MAG: hypothetical protein RL288_763 [Actinomycetota bacterium]